MIASIPKCSQRILVVSSNPLLPELGASQMAINLANGLRECGADVTLWEIPKSAKPSWYLPPFSHWQRELTKFVNINGPYDVIDAPAQAFTKDMREHAVCVARSVQPQLSYIFLNLKFHKISGLRSMLWLFRNITAAVHEVGYLIQGWARADIILCLGSVEKNWMEAKFPRWRSKIRCYFNALAISDQINLASVRTCRPLSHLDIGVRFLWIGRWVGHKGPTLLIDFIKERLKISPFDSFTIAGCGLGPYQGIPSEWRFNNRIKFIPHFQREYLSNLLSAHEVGIFTSVAEGWGLSLNEMLESGMVVFATDAGGVRDLRPYFPYLLNKFPPDINLKLSPPADFVDWKRYYSEFNWVTIATRYIQLVKDYKGPGFSGIKDS